MKEEEERAQRRAAEYRKKRMETELIGVRTLDPDDAEKKPEKPVESEAIRKERLKALAEERKRKEERLKEMYAEEKEKKLKEANEEQEKRKLRIQQEAEEERNKIRERNVPVSQDPTDGKQHREHNREAVDDA